MILDKNLMVSISGIRGHSPEVLTPQVAYAFTKAFVSVMPDGPIVLSRDSRASGHILKNAVMSALAESGREILDADLIPLPTTQIAVSELRASGGIDITASHNPIEYNGLKFLNNEGTFISKDILDKILAYISALPEEIEIQEFTGTTKNIQSEAMQFHLDKIKARAITGRPLIVAVDTVNGAGSYIVPKLLEDIDCTVIPIATDPTKPFPHVPEPKPENLVWTQNELKGKIYDICVVVDPDADRLVLIDETGALLPEESTLPLVLSELILEGKKGSVVINLSTSRMTEDVGEKNGITVLRSPVGEINVVAMMKKTGAFFGGEGGGGIIDSDIHYGRDSLSGIISIINLMRRTGKKLSELYAELPKYEMQKLKLNVPKDANYPVLYEKISALFLDAAVNRDDGLRLVFSDKTWVHIRPSNTEPIFRIIGESTQKETLDDIILKIQNLLK